MMSGSSASGLRHAQTRPAGRPKVTSSSPMAKGPSICGPAQRESRAKKTPSRYISTKRGTAGIRLKRVGVCVSATLGSKAKLEKFIVGNRVVYRVPAGLVAHTKYEANSPSAGKMPRV